MRHKINPPHIAPASQAALASFGAGQAADFILAKQHATDAGVKIVMRH
ncbi:hypothetical protein KCP70_25330 [Salmonella enterica subsp. enterica]|nr:hypothetical protein KCP70_25330 [Salmonella enterica subsp. enterica]